MPKAPHREPPARQFRRKTPGHISHSGAPERARRVRKHSNRPISISRLGKMPIQSCGQSVSAPRRKAGARLNAHIELRAKRRRSAREAIYRNRPIVSQYLSSAPKIRSVERRAAEIQRRCVVEVHRSTPTASCPRGVKYTTLPTARGRHCLTFRLNLSTSCGICVGQTQRRRHY